MHESFEIQDLKDALEIAKLALKTINEGFQNCIAIQALEEISTIETSKEVIAKARILGWVRAEKCGIDVWHLKGVGFCLTKKLHERI